MFRPLLSGQQADQPSILPARELVQQAGFFLLCSPGNFYKGTRICLMLWRALRSLKMKCLKWLSKNYEATNVGMKSIIRFSLFAETLFSSESSCIPKAQPNGSVSCIPPGLRQMQALISTRGKFRKRDQVFF